MFFADILYSKIVDDQREKDVFGGVLQKRGGKSNRGIPKFCEVELEAVVGYAASLLKTGHAFSDFHKNPAIRGKRAELILGDDLFGDLVQGHFHIFILLHRGIVVKDYNVQVHELGRGRVYRAVDQAHSRRRACTGGGGDTSKIQFVTANGDAYEMRFSLVGPDT